MRTHSLLLLAIVFAGSARAESIDFGYSWTVLPGPVFAGGTGSVALTATPNGTSSAELGSTTPAFIPGADLSSTSSAVDTPDSFSSPFGLKLNLTDTLSGASGELTFTGSLAGQLTADSSTLTATFDGSLVKTVTLGGHDYSVSIDPALVNVPAPGSLALATISAGVTVADGAVTNPPPPVPTDAPEPGSLVLAATAAAAGLIRWRTARRPADAA